MRIVEATETRKRCKLHTTTFPGQDSDELDTLAGDCPAQALVTWHGRQVLLQDQLGALHALEGRAVPDPPHPPSFSAYDASGALHTCGFYAVPVREGTAVWEGRVLTERLGDPVAGVYASWTLKEGTWSPGAALLGPLPSSPTDCHLRLQLPTDLWGHWASSHQRGYGPLDWFTQHEDDLTALQALSPGTWYTEDQRLVATHGALWEGIAGPVALWVGDAWKVVHTSQDVAALWMRPDWIALRTTGGDFVLISRRDGEVTYRQPEGTLAFLWPM